MIILATICLVLPTFTTSERGPEYSGTQLAFVAVASLVLYGMFVLTQTGEYRDFFLPVGRDGATLDQDGDGGAGVTLARLDTSSLMNRYFTLCRFEQTYFTGLFRSEYAFPPIGAGRNVLDFIVLCLENPFLPRWREGLHGACPGMMPVCYRWCGLVTPL